MCLVQGMQVQACFALILYLTVILLLTPLCFCVTPLSSTGTCVMQFTEDRYADTRKNIMSGALH